MGTRRAFLQKVVTGLFAFVPATITLADVKIGGSSPQDIDATPQQAIDVTYENYAEGSIIKIQESNITLFTNKGDVTLILSQNSKIWKGDYQGTYPLQMNDYVYAWGQPRNGGKVINLEKMWANIVNLRGVASNIQTDGANLLFHYDDSRTGTHIVTLSKSTLIMTQYNEEIAYDNNKIDVSAEQIMQVIGLKLEDKSILATRIWLS